MKFLPITEVCDFQGGTQPPKNEWSDQPLDGYVRMLQIRDFTQSERTSPEFVKNSNRLKTCNSDDVLIGRYGASIGKILTGYSGAYNVAIVKTIPNEKILNKKFLLCLLKSPSFQNFITTIGARAAQAGFNKSDLTQFNVPILSLDDQIRIAHLLGKVEGLIAQRKQHLQQLDDLLKSVFLEMFGDPVRNEKGWKKKLLRDLCASPKDIKCGPFGTQLSKSEFKKTGIPLWGIPQINSEFAVPPHDFVTQEKAKELEDYSIRYNDIVMSRKGAVGKCSLYPSLISPGIMHSDVLRIRADWKKTNPIYLCWQLRISRDVDRQIANVSSGAIMAGINVGKLKSITVFTPPIDLQNQFAIIISKIESIKSKYKKSLIDLELLYGSLSQQAFKGDLDLSRISPVVSHIVPDTFDNKAQRISSSVEQLPAINLPETDLLLPALENRKLVKNLLHKWLDIYCAQLGDGVFSAESFMNTAQIRIAELHPDTDFELGLNDYENIKTWIFDQIESGALKQTRNIISVNEKRQFGNKIDLRTRKSRKQ
jgi:type I restriction enzyme, S subunit